jgi:hypothetical protein
VAPTKRYAVGDEKLDIPFQVALLSEDFVSAVEARRVSNSCKTSCGFSARMAGHRPCSGQRSLIE